MKPKKKSSFFTFIFSFLPGAAEMYLGFMKNGVSLLTAFVLPLFAAGVIYGGDYLGILSAIIYVFAFFHARNIATAPDDEFASFPDRYIWEEFNEKMSPVAEKTVRKWVAIALICLGAAGCWSVVKKGLLRILETIPNIDMQLVRSIANNIPRIVFSILVIICGVLLIRGKKKELTEEKENGAE